MTKLSLDRFLGLVERSKLIPPEQLNDSVQSWKRRASLAQLDDARFCAEHLVDAGLLTSWQCKKLLEGRHRGFYLGKYKLLDHLGTGGMSSVYLAEHSRMQRRVAIKVLPYNRVADGAYLARFHLEAQAVAALDDKNIVRAFDLDDDGRIHYLVMEYIEGRDLLAMVTEDGPLDYHTAADYIAQAASGLAHAHAAGLVHRDIKPANLLVDRKGTVKILDLGLVKVAAAGSSAASDINVEQVLGTADYLAPEQAVNSHSVDHRADIYSLGCTLYCLLTGRPPFCTGTALERMIAHQQQTPPSVLVDRPDAPEALLAICARMMEKSPANRYQSSAEVHTALANWLASEAAAGRTGNKLEKAASQARGTRSEHTGSGDAADSRDSLLSGSARDLHRAAAHGQSLVDTDVNLQRATLKIPTQSPEPPAEAPSHASPSDVFQFAPPSKGGSGPLSHPAYPTPPPIVAPPAPAPPEADSDWHLAPPESLPHQDEPASSDAIDERHVLRMHRRSSAANYWVWIVVASALALFALVLATVAFPS
jgi:serine/threonine-protein kinase